MRAQKRGTRQPGLTGEIAERAAMWAATLRDEASSLLERLKSSRTAARDRQQIRELVRLLIEAADSLDGTRPAVSRRRASSGARSSRRRKKRTRGLPVPSAA